MAIWYADDTSNKVNAYDKIFQVDVTSQKILETYDSVVQVYDKAFSIAGPVLWNSFPDYLQGPALILQLFKRQLKTPRFLIIYLLQRFSAVQTFLCFCTI
jgi:hypothetical protein